MNPQAQYCIDFIPVVLVVPEKVANSTETNVIHKITHISRTTIHILKLLFKMYAFYYTDLQSILSYCRVTQCTWFMGYADRKLDCTEIHTTALRITDHKYKAGNSIVFYTPCVKS